MWVERGKKQYCYRSFRKDGKVCKQYLGDATDEASQNFAQELEKSKQRREERQNNKKELEILKNTIDDVISVSGMMLRSYLIENEHFKRKSEIRRISYAK